MTLLQARNRRHRHRRRRGATLVLIALLMIFLVGMVAFGVEVGRMYLVRSQLQTAVDSGALAAALALKSDSENIQAAQDAAEEFIQANRVGWLVTVPENMIQVTPGMWDAETQTFSSEIPPDDSPNAVQVGATQDNEVLFFGRVFDRHTFGVPRGATAAGSGEPLDIMMVLDLSGSMGSSGRIEALRNAAPTFVDVIEEYGDDDQIGVMGYGVEFEEFDPEEHGNGTPYNDAPQALYPPSSTWVGVLEGELTTDFNDLRNNALTSSNLDDAKYGGGTPIGAALRDGAHYVINTGAAREEMKKVVVLMSDGHANKPSGSGDDYALDMADYADSLDIRVYTISLGNGADLDLMEEIASRTGGKHFDATGSGESELTEKLTRAFRHAALSIKRTQLVE